VFEASETYKAYWRMVVSSTALCLFSIGAAVAIPKKAAAAAMTAVENFIMMVFVVGVVCLWVV
jgi:hypothetical protein